jgi:hypothetical protein
LDFDEDQLDITTVANAVQLTHLNADGLTRMLGKSFTIYYDSCNAGHNEPMLTALLVALVGKASARLYVNALNFMGITFLQHFIATPRSGRIIL